MQLPFIIAFSILGVVQLAMVVVLVRQQRTLDRVGSRTAQLTAGVSLLTDTTETGFRDVAAELERTRTGPAPRARRNSTTQRRIATLARRGQSVQEIAASEGVSEGEVSLRLQMAGSEAR